MCDVVVSINISKEVAWQRRLARALHMAQGARDASGMENYEQLHVYAVEEDYALIEADAAEAVARGGGASVVYPRPDAARARTTINLQPAAGSYDWLFLYFEEVIWPEAEGVQRNVDRLRGSKDIHVVDGDLSPKEVEAATRDVIASALLRHPSSTKPHS